MRLVPLFTCLWPPLPVGAGGGRGAAPGGGWPAGGGGGAAQGAGGHPDPATGPAGGGAAGQAGRGDRPQPTGQVCVSYYWSRALLKALT